jgi:hypothetical protein
MMALYVLVVAHGLTVNFHFCTEDHHLMSSFGDASAQCVHCLGHHHGHTDEVEFEDALKVIHFNNKCCCEDFEKEIGFTEGFTFSTEKALTVFLPSIVLAEGVCLMMEQTQASAFRFLNEEKIPYLLSGRLRTVFFSQLKLNPLVF